MNKIIQTFILLLLISVFIYIDFENYIYQGLETGLLFFILLLDFISIFSFFILKKENIFYLKKQYFKISTIFILSITIVNFQMYIDLLLGNININNVFLFINKGIVIKSIIISSIAVVSYCLGYSYNRNLFKVNFNTANLKIINTKILSIIAFCLLALFFITIDKSYFFSKSVGRQEVGGSAFYFSFLFESSICALQIINARNLIIKGKQNISIVKYLATLKYPFILLLFYLIGVMISGDRGPIIFNILFIIIVYIYITKKKYSLPKILIAVILGSSFITLLGVVRKIDDDNKSFIEKVIISQETTIEKRHYPDSFLNSTKELATSARTLNIAVNYIENGGTHTYGLFAFQDVLLLVPSLKGTFISVFGIPKELTSSAQFLTYLELGKNATWGVGSNSVADTYLDFGIIGVCVIYIIFGYMSRQLELIIFSSKLSNYIILVIAFSIFSYCIYIPRATILYSLNKSFYIVAFIFITIMITKSKFYNPKKS